MTGLLGFNIGVEFGQLAVITACFISSWILVSGTKAGIVKNYHSGINRDCDYRLYTGLLSVLAFFEAINEENKHPHLLSYF